MKNEDYHIMLVDDQKIANYINKKLIEISGIEHQISDFTDPKKALLHLNNHNPDVILLDLNMPDINGWDFLEQMKINKFNSKVAIVTSSTSKLDRKKSQDYQEVIEYYSKPLKKDDIRNLINKLASN